MRLLGFALLLPLAACSAPSNDTANALTGGLKAAEAAATLYVSQPLCPATPVCRERGVAAQIGAADNAANDLLVKYRAGQASAADVSVAIARIVALFPVKK